MAAAVVKVREVEAFGQAIEGCTNCGMDSGAVDEEAYQIRPSIWEIAYPGYSVGVDNGYARLCIGCLERRLGRPLYRADFTTGEINDPNPALHGPRLFAALVRVA